MNRVVTQQDIADYCGVHKATVSLALRGDTRITEETRLKVMAAAQELGYNPYQNQAARRMALRKHGREEINHVISLIFPAQADESSYYQSVFWGILRELTDKGFALLTSYLPHASHDISEVAQPACEGDFDQATPPVFKRGEVDGVIAIIHPDMLPLLDHLRALPGFRQRPVVSMIWPAPGCSLVMTDSGQGSYMAAKHMLELGHRHIMQFCTTSAGVVEERRLAGVTAALREYGLDPEDHLHRFLTLNDWLDPNHIPAMRATLLEGRRTKYGTEEAFIQYLEQYPEVTAVLAWNDASAVHAWLTLRNGGWSVPEDISIIGFDDTDPLLDEHGQNTLTSVKLPLREVGQSAARLIVQRVLGEMAEDQEIILPTELVLRDTTGPVCHR